MLGPWQLQDVGFKYVGAAVIVFGGYLYQFGGRSTSGSQNATERFISSAKILEDGSLGMAKIVGATTEAQGNALIAQVNQHVFLLGGAISGTASNRVVRYELESGGGVSAGRIMEPMASTISATGQKIGQIGDISYFYQGQSGLTAFRLTDAGAGPIRTIGISPTEGINWLSASPIVHKDNFLLVGGGSQTGNLAVGTVWACKVDQFNAGPWRRVGTVPAPFVAGSGPFFGCVEIVDNKLILIAGGSANPTNRVFVASLDLNANLGPWVETSALVQPHRSAGSVATENYIYVLGGFTTANLRTNTVMYAKIVRGS